ncbi:MAG: hypothetical protein HKN74_04710 [Acidimicrobiia bacterium]|nr:hypothetical protein [Acidimicrobiia bacterium]NNF09566.1 hypothetical protein [Acidimicrobiia bacterium]NNL71504.1 hypothetical protein [Acidimicrobiia bacterium]
MSGTGRTVIALGLVGAMLVALAVVVLSGGGDDDPVATLPSTTSAATSTSLSTSTTVPPSTTTTTLDAAARLAEVEQILEDLEIRWYDAVFRKDEDALSDIVAVQPLYDAAIAAMGSVVFLAPPSEETVEVSVYTVLLDRPDCLVVHYQRDLRPVLGDESLRDLVQVLWPVESGSSMYRLARTWSSPTDLWQDDCDLMDRTDIPWNG